MIRLASVVLLFALSGCTGKNLYLTAHSPKGTNYLGKLSNKDVLQLKEWLSANQRLEDVQLKYVGEDKRTVFVQVEGGKEPEVLSFIKSPLSPAFSLSGMEFSSEWK